MENTKDTLKIPHGSTRDAIVEYCERHFSKDHLQEYFIQVCVFNIWKVWSGRPTVPFQFSDSEVFARSCLIILSLSPSGNKETLCLHLQMFSSLAYAFGSQPECFRQIVYDALNSD